MIFVKTWIYYNHLIVVISSIERYVSTIYRHIHAIMKLRFKREEEEGREEGSEYRSTKSVSSSIDKKRAYTCRFA